MPQPIYANNVAGLLAANIGPSDTALLLGAGQGAAFPPLSGGNWYYAAVVHATLGTIEYVKVTAKSADTLTVVRGQDGTAAQSFTTGSIVELRLIAQGLREIDWHEPAGDPNGLATLDGAGKVTSAQLSGVVPLLDGGGKVDMAVIPSGVATDAELANYLPLAGGTVTGNVNINGTLQVGTSSGTLRVGDDASILDIGIANALRVQGIQNAAVGLLYLGNGGQYIGWDGAKFTATGATIWHSSNFDPNAKANQTNPTITGNLAATARIFSNEGYYVTGTSHIVLAPGSPGTLYFRPNGPDNSANQGTMGTSGLLQVVDVQSYCDRTLKKKLKKRYARDTIAPALQLYSFLWRSSNCPGLGPMAQDVLKAAPEYVSKDENGKLTVDKAGLALEIALSNARRIERIEKLLGLSINDLGE